MPKNATNPSKRAEMSRVSRGFADPFSEDLHFVGNTHHKPRIVGDT